jgi:hypothetical protein
MPNHYLICGTIPDIYDYRFIFDTARLHRAINLCNPGAAVSCFSFIEPLWTNNFIQPAANMLNDECRNEVAYSHLNLLPPQQFLLAVENLNVQPGDYVFLHMTNPGSGSAFTLTKKDFLSYEDLKKPLSVILNKDPEVLLAR